MSKFSFFIACLLISSPVLLIAQDKKQDKNKMVCSTPVPSRASAISNQKKVANASAKKLSCCAGAPSRLAIVRSVPKK